ncbi:MAG: TonB family protein [Bacteroidota bacterium]|nr:TonB family protein [Bacteroidota bacterium]
MYSEILINRDMNNIVFESRNMAYGAYALRRKYEDRMTTAMLISILFFISFFIGVSMYQNMNIKEELPMMTVVKLEPDPIFAPRPFIPKPKPAAPSIQSGPKKPQINNVTPTVINENIEETSKMPVQDEMKGKVIGPEIIEGIDEENSADPGLVHEPGTSTEPLAIEVTSDAPRELFAVDQMPQFPGGETAMFKFIQRNLDIPDLAKERKENMDAIVQFIIDKNGHVKDVRIIKSSSKLIESSAIDVVKGMPVWIPGRWKGKNVDVIFKLPIKIQIL